MWIFVSFVFDSNDPWFVLTLRNCTYCLFEIGWSAESFICVIVTRYKETLVVTTSFLLHNSLSSSLVASSLHARRIKPNPFPISSFLFLPFLSHFWMTLLSPGRHHARPHGLQHFFSRVFHLSWLPFIQYLFMGLAYARASVPSILSSWAHSMLSF